MSPEDLQGQVARSAAVERELREQVAGLKAEVAKLNEEVEAATARIAKLEPALKNESERVRRIRAELRLAGFSWSDGRKAFVYDPDPCRDCGSAQGATLKDVLADRINQTARAEQLAERIGKMDRELVETRTRAHAAESALADSRTAAERYRKDLEASCAALADSRQQVEQLAGDVCAAAEDYTNERAITAAQALALAEARGALEKSTARLTILRDRAEGCDALTDEQRRAQHGHELTLFEVPAWIEEQRGILERIDAALARAGEQGAPEPLCMAVTRNGHRCDREPHEEADDYHEAENAAEGGGTLLWSERYAPAGEQGSLVVCDHAPNEPHPKDGAVPGRVSQHLCLHPRAGEQWPTCTCRRTETYIENRGNCPEHPAPSRFPDHNSAAGPVWRDPIPEKQLSGSAEPASFNKTAADASILKGEPASSGQEEAGGSRRFGKTEALKRAAREAVARNPDAVIAWASPHAGPDRPWHAPDAATPPPGEQGKEEAHEAEGGPENGGVRGLRPVAGGEQERASAPPLATQQTGAQEQDGQSGNLRRDVPSGRPAVAGEQGKGADALARLRAERDRYNETEGESGEMPLLEALDAFLDAKPEQGKGGGDGRKVSVPIDLLRDLNGIALKWWGYAQTKYLDEGGIEWAGEMCAGQTYALASIILRKAEVAPAHPAEHPARTVIQPAVGPAQDGAGADLPRSGIPLIDHDFQANTWPKRDECDKRVSDDGRNSRQCGRPRREHQAGKEK